MLDKTPQPIETRYRGYRFRSRLEARWAVAFDAMGVPWTYEPQGFQLPSGKQYLPDFYLTLANGPMWAEVKPDGGDVSLFEEFIDRFRCYEEGGRQERRGVVLHDIPRIDAEGWFEDWLSGGLSDDDDAEYQFCACPSCGAIDFKYEGRWGRLDCCGDTRLLCLQKGDKCTRHLATPAIRGAYDAARAARFEHGESGPGNGGFRAIGHNVVRLRTVKP